MRPVKIAPDTRFFGNLVDASMEIDLLHEYVLNMTKAIEAAKDSCRGEVLNRRPTLHAIALDDSELFAEQFPRLLHEGTIISIIIFLERVLNDFAGDLQRTERIQLSIKDLNGSLIERFKKYCFYVAGLPFSISDQDWESLRGVLEIRNCLVHSNGSLTEFQKAPTIKAFVRRHGTPQIDDAGWLRADDRTALKVLEVAKGFVENIHEAALQKYAGHRRRSR